MRVVPMFLIVVLLASACTSDEPSPTSTTVATTTTAAPTTAAPTTTTTTTEPFPDVAVTVGEAPDEVADQVTRLYAWLADRRNQQPILPNGLKASLAVVGPSDELTVAGEASVAELPNGTSVAVVTADDDVVLLADVGTGWRIVGAKLPRFDHEAWYGEGVRMLLVLGSDARPGQNQQRFRADSIHILTINGDGGAIVGFPRDSWVPSPVGNIKFTNLMAGRGPQIMLDTTRELTGLPLEGYVVTGFLGFTQLVDAFGGIDVDLPNAIRGGLPGFPDFAAGLQHLNGSEALMLARIRKTLPNGDFGRSENHGRIIQGALRGAQLMGVGALPGLIEMLLTHAWSDLTSIELLTFMASAYEVGGLDNLVLPGGAGRAGSQSVVFLSSSVDSVYADLADGLLDNG